MHRTILTLIIVSTVASAVPVTEALTINSSTGAVLNPSAINFGGNKLKLNGTTLESAFVSLSGSYTNPPWISGLAVGKLQQSGASNGQALLWNGFAWAPGNVSGSLADGDKGDVTVSSGGVAWTLDDGAVSNSKLANSSVTINGHALSLGNTLTLTKSDLGLGNVENSALSAWSGSPNVTTLGTVTTGTWQGSIITPNYLGIGSGISTKFLRGDGTWQAMSGGGDVNQIADNIFSGQNIMMRSSGTALSISNDGSALGLSISASMGCTGLTIANDFTTVFEVGSDVTFGTQLILRSGTAVTTSVIGAAAFDTNALGSANHGAIQINDGTIPSYVVAFPSSEALVHGWGPVYNQTEKAFKLTPVGDMLMQAYDPQTIGYISGYNDPIGGATGGYLGLTAGLGVFIESVSGSSSAPGGNGGIIQAFGGAAAGSTNTIGDGQSTAAGGSSGSITLSGGAGWVNADSLIERGGGAGGNIDTHGSDADPSHSFAGAGGYIHTFGSPGVNGGNIDTTAGGSLTMGTGNLVGGNVSGTILTTTANGSGLTNLNASSISGGTISAGRLPGTVVQTTDSGTVTNGMLAGEISNSKLANSAMTIAGASVSLGGSISIDTMTGLGGIGLVKRSGVNSYAVATGGMDYVTPGQAISMATGRLTLSSGTPVLTGSASGAGTVYFTPYRGNSIALYDGLNWKAYVYSEQAITLSALAASTVYDVFAYDSGGVVTLETFAWSNATTRATALAWQDGVRVKAGAASRRYLGSFVTDVSKQCSVTFGSYGTAGQGQCDVWNMNNRVRMEMSCGDTTDSWTYSTASFRAYNGANGVSGTNNRITLLVGMPEDSISATFIGGAGGGANSRYVGIGVDSTTTNSAHGGYFPSLVNTFTVECRLTQNGLIGQHYFQALEKGAGSISFVGDNGGAIQTGLTVTWEY